MSGLSKILFLSLWVALTANGLWATEFVDEVSLYVYGDVGYIESSLNSLAMVFASDAFTSIVHVAALMFISYSGYSWMQAGSLDLTIKDAAMYAAMALLVVNTNMTITVKIFDKRADGGMMNYVDNNGNPVPTFAAVANVPYVIGFVAGASSYLRYSLIEVSDTAFSAISDISYSKIGFMQNFIIMRNLAQNANFSASNVMQDYERKMSAYIEKCVLEQIAPTDPSVVDKLKSPPTGDLISFMAPANIGINSSMKITYGNLPEMSCENFYATHVSANANAVADELFTYLQSINRPGNPEAMAVGLTESFKTKTSSTVIASTNPLKSYLFNAASINPLAKAIANNQMGLDQSATGVINSIAGVAATRQMQTEGVGRLEWLSTVLPHAIHLIMGIVYSVGIFPLILSMAFRSPFMIMMYAKSLLSLELISYAMSVVHNATTYFAQHDAANKLAFLESQQNAGSMLTLPAQLDYIATMSGIAGVIGVAVAFGLPSFIMKGDISGITSALGGMAGRYNNNLDAMNEMQHKQLELARTQDQQHRDNKEVSNGVGEMDYAMRVKAGMDRSAQAFAAISATSSSQNRGNYQLGATGGAMNQAGSTMGVGQSGVSNEQAMSAGMLTGSSSGGNMMGLANSGTTMTQARDSGITGGRGQGVQMQENAKMAHSENFFEGQRRGIEAQNTKTVGTGSGRTATAGDLSALATQASGQYQSQFADARGFNKGAMNGNDLKSGYAQGLESSAAKKASSTNEYGGRVNTATALSAGISEGAQSAGADIGSAVALGKYGANGLSNASKNMAATKTASMMGASKEISSMGLDNAMNLTSQASEAKQAGDFQTTREQNKKFSGQGGARGAAIINANKGVDDNYASLSGEMGAGKRSNDGSLTTGGHAGVMQKAGEAAKMEMFAAANMNNTAATSQNSAVKEKLKTELQEIIKADKWASKNMSKSEKEQAAENYANEVMKSTGLTDENGKAVTGFDRAMSFAKMKAGNTFGVSKGTMSNGTSISMNTGGENGSGVRVSLDSGTMVSSGDSTSVDSSGKINSSTSNDSTNSTKVGANKTDITGANWQNPFQAAVDYVTGGSLSGGGLEVVGGAIQAGAVAMGIDQALAGGAGRKAIYKKVSEKWHNKMGHEQGVNAAGKSEWGNPSDFKKDGWAKNDAGKWEHPSNQRIDLGSDGLARNTATTAIPTTTSTIPETHPTNFQNIKSSMTPSLNDMSNYTSNNPSTQGVTGLEHNPKTGMTTGTSASMSDAIANADHPHKTGGAGGWKTQMALMATAIVGSQYSAQAAEAIEIGVNTVGALTGLAGQIITPSKLGEGSDLEMLPVPPNRSGVVNGVEPITLGGSTQNVDHEKLKREQETINMQNSLKESEGLMRENLNMTDDIAQAQTKAKEELDKLKKQKQPRIILQGD